MLQKLTDLELIELYRKNGDKECIGVLYKRYTLMCFAICRKYTKDDDQARDAVMDVFEKLFISVTKFEIHNFKSWLHSVCRNHCLMDIRSNKKWKMQTMNRDDYDPTSFVELNKFLHPAAEIDKEQRLQSMEKAMEHLNEKQRTCIELFYLKEKSYSEVSAQTGFSMNEVKSFIQNGKRNLKIVMEKNGMVGNRFMDGTVILSKADLVMAFDGLPHKSNVGIHEFVHLLDKEDGVIDGIPEALIRNDFVGPWLFEIKKEIKRIEEGKSDINPYALTNNAEFLAVVSEYFFDNPKKFKQEHPELYGFLSTIFKKGDTGSA